MEKIEIYFHNSCLAKDTASSTLILNNLITLAYHGQFTQCKICSESLR